MREPFLLDRVSCSPPWIFHLVWPAPLFPALLPHVHIHIQELLAHFPTVSLDGHCPLWLLSMTGPVKQALIRHHFQNPPHGPEDSGEQSSVCWAGLVHMNTEPTEVSTRNLSECPQYNLVLPRLFSEYEKMPLL